MRSKVSLIVQEGVMIPQSETPVLPLDLQRGYKGALELLPLTVRFLRSGCPSVQWLVQPGVLEFVSDERRRSTLDAVHSALCNLQTLGENFRIQAPTDEWKPGTVITLSRVTAQPARQMVPATFCTLPLLDKFRLHHSSENDCQVVMVQVSPGVYRLAAIALAGERAGREVEVQDTQTILKIVE